MTTKKGRQGGDDDWDDQSPGYGTDHERKAAGDNKGRVNSLREDFWRACGIVTLSVPRWDSIPRCNANLKWMLTGGPGRPPIPEQVIRTSFEFFRNEAPTLGLGTQLSCWEAYFRNRKRYLDQARAAQIGARAGTVATRRPGDIAAQQRLTRERQRAGDQLRDGD